MVRRVYILWLALATIAGCDVTPNGTSTRGIHEVTMADGLPVYFKREIRGQNYDALWISLNGDPCHSFDPQVDYRFAALGPLVVYYMPESGGLITYSTTTLEPPSRPARSLRIENRVLEPLAFQELTQTYQSRGLTRLSIATDSKLRCK